MNGPGPTAKDWQRWWGRRERGGERERLETNNIHTHDLVQCCSTLNQGSASNCLWNRINNNSTHTMHRRPCLPTQFLSQRTLSATSPMWSDHQILTSIKPVIGFCDLLPWQQEHKTITELNPLCPMSRLFWLKLKHFYYQVPSLKSQYATAE